MTIPYATLLELVAAVDRNRPYPLRDSVLRREPFSGSTGGFATGYEGPYSIQAARLEGSLGLGQPGLPRGARRTNQQFRFDEAGLCRSCLGLPRGQ
jgi:hypothetical protein